MRRLIDIAEGIEVPETYVYMEGSCTILAYTIHKRFGFPIYTDEDQTHAVCRLPDGKTLDAEGIDSKHWYDVPFEDVESLTNGITPRDLEAAELYVRLHLEPLLHQQGYLEKDY